MHPEIARELTAQRGRELRERAQQAAMARMASRRLRAMRRGAGLPGDADDFVCPAIPDYVDGSFRTASLAGDQAASAAGRVPSARRAA
jgi:hypothetical protein